MAKTARGALTAGAGASTPPRKGPFDAARDAYAAYAGHIYFRGDHETGLDYIQGEGPATSWRPAKSHGPHRLPPDHRPGGRPLHRQAEPRPHRLRPEKCPGSTTTVFAISFNRENYNLRFHERLQGTGGIDYSADGWACKPVAGRPGFQIDEESERHHGSWS
ncbi:MAG: hypothetical protein ACLUPV_05260 [Bilophila wadsworthia]